MTPVGLGLGVSTECALNTTKFKVELIRIAGQCLGICLLNAEHAVG